MFLAQNGCELTFSHRERVLLFVVAVGGTMPFSPGWAAGWSARRRGWSPGVPRLVWRGCVQIWESGVAVRGCRANVSEVGGVPVGGRVAGHESR